MHVVSRFVKMACRAVWSRQTKRTTVGMDMVWIQLYMERVAEISIRKPEFERRRNDLIKGKKG
jgi:hypothetical protein